MANLHNPFDEFTPPATDELVSFEEELRQRFEAPVPGRVFRFIESRASVTTYGAQEWLLVDELNNMDIVVEVGELSRLVRRATISEKDAYFRKMDPVNRRINENLAQTFRK